MIEIKEAVSKKDIRKFIDFPIKHYKGNPCFVPFLRADEINMANPKKNPAMDVCKCKYFLAYKDGKLIVEVMCELSPSARISQYIPKLLADNGFHYMMRENSNKPVTVYEFEISREQILQILAMLENSNREELKSYKYPDAFLTLLNRSPETGDTPGETLAVSTVIVRLNATN